MGKKKLPLSKLQVKSFTTTVRGGQEPIGIEPQRYNTVYSGVCTCLMFCASREDLSCPDGCPVVQVEPRDR
jgi:hypothetical protein